MNYNPAVMSAENIDHARIDQLESDAVALLQQIEEQFSPATLANSFGAEDMVLMDLVCRHAIGVGIFVLDTGRLPAETYNLMDESRKKYGATIDVYYPQTLTLQEFVRENGVNAFYNSLEMRKGCCGIRKVEPLGRALKERKAWVTGLRREQSPTREDLGNREWDEGHNMEKFNPLIEWTERDVWGYIHKHGVPYNKLHDQHFPSIGCAPCTRSVTIGEDIRAGRWWWENPDSKECGLHVAGAAPASRIGQG